MPISLEPDKRFAIVLDSDIDKPKESRPTFWAKSQTMRGHESVLEAIEFMYKPDATVAEVFKSVCDKLTEVIVGWDNMGPFVYGQHGFAEVLTHLEALELLRKVGRNSHLEPEEKKS
jgi:hypothetical protein